jgi:hypothetical protein
MKEVDMNVTSEIRKLKELLNDDALTKDEFELPQKKLLNLNKNRADSKSLSEGYPDSQIVVDSFSAKPRKKKGRLIAALIFCGVTVIGAVGCQIENNSTSSDSTSDNSVQIVFNATEFWTSETTTVTEQELIEKLGAPESTEDWNYTTATLSYPIHTLYYSDENGGSYAYHFNNEILSRISIDDVDIPYNGKDDILPMFGLSQYANTVVVADTGVAYRVKRCGVPDFWVAIMDDQTLQSIRISFHNFW